MKKYMITGLIIIIMMISACKNTTKINSFEECVAEGNPVMESYPRQCQADEKTFTEEINEESIETICSELGGEWIETANECENINEADCLNIGGNFNECASACRNNPEAQMCTTQCVLVCEFNTPIGGERDEHGCLGPAGYTWNEEVNACLREWELQEDTREAAKIAVENLKTNEFFTVVEVITMKCPGCFTIKLEEGEDRTPIQAIITDWNFQE
ncbi:MAG: hypothetical protein KKF89_01865 [Nanoarchaeota archaeon]|nr:hypothetical protein [Nanoarchaeota archaeon]MBU1854444.1 hypothetical protein [Nanoarchaeota archaeon]